MEETKSGVLNKKFDWLDRHPILSIVFVLVVIGIIGSSLSSGSSSPAASSSGSSVRASTDDQPQLELENFSCDIGDYFFTISGEVKNISGESMKNVTAVGTTYTADGTFVNSDDALIDYNPILPGQTSPFKVIMTLNPEMKKCNLAFKSLLGGTITTVKKSSAK